MPQHKQFSVLRRMFLAFVLSLLSVLPAMADTVIIDPLQFDLNQDGKSYSVCLYNMDYSGEIVIPALCNGLPVTRVGSFFEGNFTSIDLPNSLYSIEEHSFENCNSLEKVTSSSSSVPSYEGYIGSFAFSNCGNLTKITIPNSIDSIGDWAFYGCKDLKEIVIPNTVKEIGEDAFRCCEFESITLPDGLTKISAGLLAQTSLKSIKIPDSVTEIGGFAFESCKQLESVILPNSLTKIGNSAFYGCNYLKDIKLANSLTSIGKRAFYNSGISTLVLPNSLTCLGDEAFSMCFSLKKVIFGTGLTEINPQTFSGCNLTDIVLPPNLIKINSGAFYTWTPIESLVIGSKVKEIGSSAFGSKDGIKSIYITSSEPPVAFENTFDSYTADLWLQDQDAIDKYTVSQPCWCKFEKKAMICAEKLEQKEEELILEAGATHQLSVTVKPENATLKHVFWRSTNPNVASVDNNGLVTFPETNSPTYEIGQKAPASDCKIIAYTLYDNGPIAEFTVKMPTTAVEDVTVDRKDFNADENIDVFNINGVRVSDSTEGLAPGLYILRQGMTTKKVFIK